MKRPVEMEMSIEIDAPPAVVWPYLVDWERLGRWMKEGSGFKVTSPHRAGVGVTSQAKIRIGGLSSIDRVRVTEWQPPQLLQIEHLGWVKGTGTMRLVPAKQGTQLRWKEVFVPPWGILGAAGIRMWVPLMRKTFQRDLGVLKALVESEQRG